MSLKSVRWTVGVKIGGAFAILILLLGVSGAAGLAGVWRLSAALDYISGPAWSSAAQAYQARLGAAEQIAAVDDLLLRGDAAAAGERISRAEEQTRLALEVLESQGLLGAEALAPLAEGLAGYTESRDRLRELHRQSVATEARMIENFEAFKRFLLEAEDLGDGEDEVAMAALHIRVALQSRFLYFNRLAGESDNPVLKVELRQAAKEMRRSVRHLARAPEFAAAPPFSEGGPRPGLQLEGLFSDHLEAFEQAVEQSQQLELAREAYAASAQSLAQTVAEIEAAQNRLVAGMAGQVGAAKTAAESTVGAVLILSVVVGVGALLLILRSVVVPIRRVARRLRAIAEGDGDLTAQIEVHGRDEIADLALGFNGFVTNLRETMVEVNAAIQRLVVESRSLMSIAQETLTGMERQKHETDEVATAAGEMTTSAAAVARNAELAATRADGAEASVAAGRRSVSDNRSAVQELAEAVSRAVSTVGQLDQDAQNIGSILDVIRGVAEQTSMLALNAAIEAARAGEHGRGFAVVADEVRTLARRTQEATENIQRLIEGLQRTAQSAAEAMKSGHERVDFSVEQARLADAALDEITEAVRQIAGSSQEIAGAAEEQSAVTKSIAHSVEAIVEVAVATNEGAQRNASAVGTLDDLAEQLQGLVGRFRV